MKRLMLGVLLLSGCGPELENDVVEGVAVEAPLAGVNGRVDSADHDCHVALRTAGRVSNGRGGYVMRGSSWVFEAIVDVSDAAIADGASPALLYTTGTRWTEATGTAIGGGLAGFQRIRFEISQGLPGEGMSGTSLSRARVELAPFLRMREGGRLFDHNRNEDPFTNHVLRSSGGFALADAPAICPARTVTPPPPPADATSIRFLASGAIEQSAGVIEDAPLVLEYDVARLPRCRQSGWDVTARVRFQPSGRIVEGSIRSGRFVTRVPGGAVRIEVWFENSAGSCRTWDSNGGRDHVFPVLRAPGWIGSPVVKITRATGHACSGGGAMGEGFRYDTWARERSVMGNACFEVWQAGTTDWSNPDMWRLLDARVYYRFDRSQPFSWTHAAFVDRVGNNARFSVSLASLDPFRRYHCPTGVPTTVTTGGQPYERAEMELYFSVNGRTLTQANGAPYLGTFEDYPANAWRAGNCP